MAQKQFNVGVVGASGLVGRELLGVLEQRRFPIARLELFASPKSAGRPVSFSGTEIPLRALGGKSDFQGLDLVFFTAGSATSEVYAFLAAQAGALVIDNASVFRLRPEVPLVVPEVNGETLLEARQTRVVANPNCTTAQLVMALKPLQDFTPIRRVVVASYQAVSGKGKTGLEELERQIQDHVLQRAPQPRAFPHPIAFNCIPQIDRFLDDGFTGEEHKVMAETRKILGDDSIRVAATCVRVPVFNGHSEAVHIETDQEVSPRLARELLGQMPGVRVLDDPAKNLYPLAMDVSGKDEVFVGRIRRDPSVAPGKHGLAFWVVGDNLRKGAALNAVQIAEKAVALGIL